MMVRQCSGGVYHDTFEEVLGWTMIERRALLAQKLINWLLENPDT